MSYIISSERLKPEHKSNKTIFQIKLISNASKNNKLRFTIEKQLKKKYLTTS